MNKKGFAISIILYSIVFLIVTILYMLLGIEKKRYTVNSELRKSVVERVNEPTSSTSSGDTLYEILENVYNQNNSGYVRLYSGLATDTYNNIGSDNVYYLTGSSAKENGNLLFGGYCWQIVRTTKTRGVKIIYNGLALNEKCPTTGRTKGNGARVTPATSPPTDQTLSNGAYIYGKYFTINGNNFTIADDSIVKINGNRNITWGSGTYKSLIGTFTCKAAGVTTCSTLYHVGGYESNSKARCLTYRIGQNSHYSVLGNSAFNSQIHNHQNVGYMFYTDASSSYVLNNLTSDLALNTYNSAIKGVLDSWYRQNISTNNNLTQYIDSNAVYCNDRSITSSTNEMITFTGNNISLTNLSCANASDRFSNSNDNTSAHLDYPIGLLTLSELNLSTKQDFTYLNTGTEWWLLTPVWYSNLPGSSYDGGTAAFTECVSGGGYSCSYAWSADGMGSSDPYDVRGVITLKPNIRVTGSGTYSNPYIILGL